MSRSFMLGINTRVSRILASYCIALLALISASGAWAQESPEPAGEEKTVELTSTNPQQVQDLKFKNERGATLALNVGGPPLTAVHLWATWCAPCVTELPQVEAVHKAYRQKGLKVIAISLDGNMDKVRQFIDANGIETLLPLLDVNNASFNALQAKGLPITVFFNARGETVARADGPLDWNSPKVKEFIETQLAAKP
jgi:thiol-disulfide isomerase/thioredoxin